MNTGKPQTDALIYIGESLYGSLWITDLAKAIDTPPRTVRQWLATGRVNPKVWPKLDHILRHRMSQIVTALDYVHENKPER